MTMALPPGLVERITVLTAKKKSAIRYGPVGIEFDQSGIRLAQFRKTSDRVEPSSAVYLPVAAELRSSTRKFAAFIRKAMRRHGFVGREVVSCMPSQDVKMMMISYLHQ